MPQPASGFLWTQHLFPIYRLVKVGLSPEAIALLQESYQGRVTFFRGRKRKKEWERRREGLLQAIFRLWGEPCRSYCVCQSPITYFDKWKFTDYREEKWVDYLTQRGNWFHYVVLGNAPCLREVLPKHAMRMKSLRLFLREREFDGGLEELLGFLEEEYGIVADLHFLEEHAGYQKLPMLGAAPCNVLDFSGEGKAPCRSAPQGSVWMDFDGIEEKRRRFEAMGVKVQYVSLAKEWKQPGLS